MSDLLTQLGIDPHLFWTSLVLGSILTVLMYYRFIVNIFDQLILMMISVVACDTLVFGMPWDNSLKIEYAFFTLFFWIGFCIRGKVRPFPSPIRHDARTVAPMELTLIILFIVLMAGNLAVAATSGVAILSSNPDTAKVTLYQGGFGFVRRLNMMPFNFFVSGCFVLILLNHRRRLYITLLVIMSLMIMTTGSKSALLPLVIAAGLVIAHPTLTGADPRLASRLARYNTVIFLAGASIAMLIFVIDAGREGLSGGVQMMLKRVLFNGDVIIYYFPTRGANPDLIGLNWVNYLEYLFKGWLATFRIISEYPPALGSVIMGVNQPGLGPNPLYFVRADIFFGPVAGCLYCLYIGLATAWIRQLFFTRKAITVNSSIVRLALATFAFGMPIDSGGTIGYALDIVMFIVPIWLLAKFLIYSRDRTRAAQLPGPSAEHMSLCCSPRRICGAFSARRCW